MTNDKVEHARELLRIALKMLDDCEAFVSGAMVAGALDALGGAPCEGDAEAPPAAFMANAMERRPPALRGMRSCA